MNTRTLFTIAPDGKHRVTVQVPDRLSEGLCMEKESALLHGICDNLAAIAMVLDGILERMPYEEPPRL